MKMLDNKVNIIPIIAKADIVAKSELNKFKAQVRTSAKCPLNLKKFAFPSVYLP